MNFNEWFLVRKIVKSNEIIQLSVWIKSILTRKPIDGAAVDQIREHPESVPRIKSGFRST